MLRRRLFLSLIPLLVLVFAVGAYAIVLLSRLAAQMDSSIAANQRSERALESMRVALTRMEAGLRLALQGETNSSAAFFNQNAPVFENNLAAQMENPALLRERPLIGQLRTNFSAFRESGSAILRVQRRRDREKVFEAQILPRLMTINLQIEQVRKASQKNVLATGQDIQRINRQVTNLMTAGLAVALLLAVFASVRLGRAILQPIQILTRAVREVGEGNLDQSVPVLTHDELGELATAFNKMAAQLRVYRQSTSEQIMRLHRTMEAALASFPDPIFVLNQEGDIELQNPAARDLFAQLKLGGGLPDNLSATAGEVLRTGQDFLPHSFKDVILLRVNGDEKSFLPRVHTMRGEDQRSVGVAVVLHDVTRFRLMDDVKSNLVATVSHELKTPLTSLRMVLYLLLEKKLGPLTNKQDELLEMARKDAERLLRILNDLLDLARLEAGDSPLNRERTAPALLLQGVAEELQQIVTEQGHKLNCLVQPRLPAVFVDRQRIGHVFHNFITNALKYSPPGGDIQLRAVQTDDRGVRFSVADSGPGVPEEFQGRIFDRFFRIPGQKKPGWALGLSIAREIVVAHGGRIGVRSRPGEGSEFYFVLSAADEQSGD